MSENKNPLEVAFKKADGIVLSVIGQKGLTGFVKAHTVSTAIIELEKLLDAEYMKPIMALQGTTLGFKTDKDLVRNPSGKGYVKGDGYPVEIVRRCLIEAVLKGYQPTNNEFNIIGGNMYPAKNGLERKANEWEGLKYSIIPVIKAFTVEKGSALVDAQIKWSIDGIKNDVTVPIPLKIDAYTSVDAAIGKAKRKALAWLLSNLSGESVVDGDVDDTTFEEVGKESLVKDVTSSASKEPTIKISFTEDMIADCAFSIEMGATIDQIKEQYDISPELEAKLKEAVKK